MLNISSHAYCSSFIAVLIYDIVCCCHIIIEPQKMMQFNMSEINVYFQDFFSFLQTIGII